MCTVPYIRVEVPVVVPVPLLVLVVGLMQVLVEVVMLVLILVVDPGQDLALDDDNVQSPYNEYNIILIMIVVITKHNYSHDQKICL